MRMEALNCPSEGGAVENRKETFVFANAGEWLWIGT